MGDDSGSVRQMTELADEEVDKIHKYPLWKEEDKVIRIGTDKRDN